MSFENTTGDDMTDKSQEGLDFALATGRSCQTPLIGIRGSGISRQAVAGLEWSTTSNLHPELFIRNNDCRLTYDCE